MDLKDRKSSIRVHLHFFPHKNVGQERENQSHTYIKFAKDTKLGHIVNISDDGVIL